MEEYNYMEEFGDDDDGVMSDEEIEATKEWLAEYTNDRTMVFDYRRAYAAKTAFDKIIGILSGKREVFGDFTYKIGITGFLKDDIHMDIQFRQGIIGLDGETLREILGSLPQPAGVECAPLTSGGFYVDITVWEIKKIID